MYVIKVKDYVIFLYKWSMYTQYKYYTCMRVVYVNLKIDIEKF